MFAQKSLALVFATLFAFSAITRAADIAALRVESRTNPLAIETPAPRFSWQIPATANQAYYQIRVATSPDRLMNADLWDSAKVASDQTFQIAYAGKPLASGQRRLWQVTSFDKANLALTSTPAFFSMGLLAPSDWKAKWIGFPNDESTRAPQAAPMFRKEFSLTKPIARAIVHVCGLGQYELTLNGKKVGDAVLGPAWTTYAKTASYDTFDVTAQLAQGGNAFGIMLGNGMYNVIRTPGRYSKYVGSENTGTLANPKAILQLDIEFADGTHTLVTTDDSWKTARGPITYNHPYGGEDYDARREIPGWDAPNFLDATWAAAAIVPPPAEGTKLIAAINPPIKIHKSFSPVKVMQPVPGVWVYDMGQNLSGWPHIKIKGPAGSSIRMIPTELLSKDGTIGGVVSAERGLNWYTYTLKGAGVEEWRPRFGSYGFRYIQVTGATPPEGTTIAATITGGIGRQPPPLGEIPAATAYIVEISSEWIYADLPVDGTFTSSDETLNRIHRLIDAAIVSNAQSILTDCPHREKLGWLEQAHLMADSIALNYDVSGLYAKVAMDMRDAQLPDGLVPNIAPEFTRFQNSFRDSPEWGATAILAPWALHTYYGDTRTLATNFDSMKTYMNYLATKADGQILSHGLGDWCDVTPAGQGGNAPKNTTQALTGTAIYFQDAKQMESAARLLKREDDRVKYAALAESIRAAFNKKFYNAETGQYEKGSQTANAMPLALGMVDPANRDAVTKHLVDHVKEVKYRITAGDVGFVYVINALINANQEDVVYRMLTQSDGPGYVMQLNNGATTLTEMWNGGNSSNNHLMLGHGELWFYRGLAGIQMEPGTDTFQHIVIRPEIVESLAQIDGKSFAKATVNTVRGTVESGWTLQGKKLTMTVTIPPSATATVYVPMTDAKTLKITPDRSLKVATDATQHVAIINIDAGTYTFESTLP